LPPLVCLNPLATLQYRALRAQLFFPAPPAGSRGDIENDACPFWFRAWWCRKHLPPLDPCDVAAALLLAVLVALVLATFRDYAISNDEEVQQRYGELIVSYYASGFVDQSVFHFKNLYLYGGLFDLVAVGLERLLPLDIYSVRHLLSALTGVSGIAVVWTTGRAIGGPRAGLLAAVALAVCGPWYGAMFNHTKDIPFATAMMATTLCLLRIGRELPRPSPHLVLLFGLLCGCALGLRVLGLLLLSYAGMVVAAYAPISRTVAWREAGSFVARSTLALLSGLLVAYAIMVVAWPWAFLAPLNPLRAMFAFASFHYQIHTILSGRIYDMADVPRWYVPTYLAIKLTLPLIVGACLAVLGFVRPLRRAKDIQPRRPQELAFVAFAAFFPLICNVVGHGPGFSGMRHFLFTVPPIAVLAGLGLDSGLRLLAVRGRLVAAAGVAAVVLALGWNATTLYRLHPDEYQSVRRRPGRGFKALCHRLLGQHYARGGRRS